jgi:SanA protein
MYTHVRQHVRLLLVVIAAIGFSVLALIVGSAAAISPSDRYILAADTDRHMAVGLVLGAGVTPDGRPYKELQARLDTAAEAYHNGLVDMLIVSGDNRYASYNEPGAMMDYLIDKRHIPARAIQPDYAGRSTYESCERAARVFHLKDTIIFSAGSHLPRAIYLCRHFGIEAYGIASGIEANNSTRRELVARVKAVLNVTVKGEPTVLGDPISLP